MSPVLTIGRLASRDCLAKKNPHGIGLLIRSSVRLDRQAALEAFGMHPRRTFETLRPGNSPTCKRAGCLSRMWSISRRVELCSCLVDLVVCIRRHRDTPDGPAG